MHRVALARRALGTRLSGTQRPAPAGVAILTISHLARGARPGTRPIPRCWLLRDRPLPYHRPRQPAHSLGRAERRQSIRQTPPAPVKDLHPSVPPMPARKDARTAEIVRVMAGSPVDRTPVRSTVQRNQSLHLRHRPSHPHKHRAAHDRVPDVQLFDPHELGDRLAQYAYRKLARRSLGYLIGIPCKLGFCSEWPRVVNCE